MNLEVYLTKQSKKIELGLTKVLNGSGRSPALQAAMRYSVLGGGKRIRPILCLAACDAVGGNSKKAFPAALAIELIHSYSLVHDDLPCMDNDSMRRGKPSCHKKFGESTALLAGDALLTKAFEVLNSGEQSSSLDLKNRMEAAHLIAQSAGISGMVGGQAADLDGQGKPCTLSTLDFIHKRKTGALIAVSTRVGALLGNASASKIKTLYEYGQTVGLLFQIVDDILDGDGYAKLLGVENARTKAKKLLNKTHAILSVFGQKADRLKQIAEFIYNRSS